MSTAWKTAQEILGKRSKGGNLMILGIFLIATGGGGLGIANWLGLDSTVPALFLVFGILSFVVGLGMYAEEGEKHPRRGRSSKKGRGITSNPDTLSSGRSSPAKKPLPQS